MYTVKGSFKDGVATPDEPVYGQEGQPVLITFLSNGEEMNDVPTLEEVVARIKALGPNLAGYTPPRESLAEALANVADEELIDAVERERQWAIIEAEMKKRDQEDDRAEGRF
jgi:hypothetical protein